MPIIDEKGRLFGKINVIDAAALLLVLVFVVAGAAYLIDTSDPATVHAQVEARDVPTELAALLTPGTEVADGDVVVTDVRSVQTTADSERVYAKLRITAEDSDGILRLGQTQITPGATLPLQVDGRSIQADILLTDTSEDLVYLAQGVPFLFASQDVALPVQEAIRMGQTGVFEDLHLLELDGSHVVPTGSSLGDVYVWGTASRLTPASQGSGSASIAPGASGTFSFPARSLQGTFLPVPQETPPVQEQTIDVTVSASGSGQGTLPPVAVVGDQETIGGQAIAEVDDVVRLQGASVLTDEDQITTQLQIDLTLQAVEARGELLWKGEALINGRTLTFHGTQSVFSGQITAIDHPGTPRTTSNVTLLIQEVPQWAAGQLDAGDTEATAAGTPLLSITDVAVEPSQLLVTTQDGDVFERDHPSLRDVTLNATVFVEAGQTWKTTHLAPGVELFIQPDGFPLYGTVQQVRP